ncbi:MAG: hypothetical protein Q4G67_11345 [Actinomycetia bacterium]|nr:hypothetical protein [Actinomycetes bacterium]
MTTTQTITRRGRRLLAGLSALALVALLSGCFYVSPMATENVYNPGHGVSVDLGPVQVRNLMVVGTAEGEPATVSAYVLNNGTEAVTVNFSAGGEPVGVEVPRNAAMQISPAGEGEGVTLDSLGVAPGAMVPLSVQVDDGAPAQVGVPSITAGAPMYEDFGN